ncbi:hypothetical protein PM082_023657 [Marasmius tenuissimus]|nr:hypothetical protein PM082_023657 [Marasmius tenuissimus]
MPPQTPGFAPPKVCWEMVQAQNFGNTISSGIQDIAALLPLLGTEQCERHVGEALQKGYLYAAATPLSIFGSLRVVKTASTTFLATTLHDAGFATTGSVASMVTLTPGTKRYGAEVQLECLMKEQHIDNPEMISGIEWFGWKKAREVGTGLLRLNLSWNLCLVLTSALGSTFALIPYIYLAVHDQRNALAWVFPALRSFGSFLCVVCVQFALQLRIHQITSSSLLLMKARYRHPLSIEESVQEQDVLLELRLMTLALESSMRSTSDLEKGLVPEMQPQEYEESIPTPLSVDLTMVMLQVLLAVGMGMIVAGYVGCFNLVSQTSAKNGPYIWFGVEAILSVIRLVLWGCNPSWDEQDTGLTLWLALLTDSPPDCTGAGAGDPTGLGLGLDDHADQESSPAAQGQQRSAPTYMFPFITSLHHLRTLTEKSQEHFKSQDMQWRDSFVAHNVEDFLATATPYVGPLGRIEVDGSSIYYAILAEFSHKTSQRLLCATVVPHAAGWDSLSFLLGGGKTWHSAFTSRTRQLAGTRSLEVAFDEKFEGTSTGFLDSKAISLVVDYSNNLFCRLVAPPESRSDLHLSWSLTFPSLVPTLAETPAPLSHLHTEYMRIGQMCDLKGDYCLQRGNKALGLKLPNVDSARDAHAYSEYALIFDSAVMETYLCIMEQRFVRRAGLSSAFSHQLGLQWIQKMEERPTSEKSAVLERCAMWSLGDPILQCYCETWDTLSSEIRSLRLLPADSPVLKHWERIIINIFQHGRTPHVSELFGRKPFAAAIHLRNFLLPFFKIDQSSYHGLMNVVRLSIQRLLSIIPLPYFGHVDPQGPGSPEFSPPYTFITSPLIESGVKAFMAQIHSIKVLALSGHLAWTGIFSILCSSSTPLLSLTTIVLSNLQFTPEDASKLLVLLEKQPGLTFVMLDRCDNYVGRSDSKKIDCAIARNRRRWREAASQLRRAHYQVGLQLQEYNGKQFDLQGHSMVPLYGPQGYDVVLQQEAVIVAMIHIPYHGRIVPILTAKAPAFGCQTLTATLFRHPWCKSNCLDKVCTVRSRFATPNLHHEWNPRIFEDFPEVVPGSYKVQIHIEETEQFIFRELTVEFIPTCLVIPTEVVFAFVERSHSDLNALERHVSTYHETERSQLPGGSSGVVETSVNCAPSGRREEEKEVSPDYRLMFSLHSPDGCHHGSYTFSPEAMELSRLHDLSMVLSLSTGRFQVGRYWVPDPRCDLETLIRDQEYPTPVWSEVHGLNECSGLGERGEQPQHPGGAPEEMEQDISPCQCQKSLEVTCAVEAEVLPTQWQHGTD